MSVLWGIISANILLILFNLIGMSTGLKPPSTKGFVALWLLFFTVCEASILLILPVTP